jgi:hypothetical protein
MGQVEHGVVKPPNKATKGGDDRENGFLPLSGSASPVRPNEAFAGDHRGGSFPLSGGAPMTKPPEHRFNVSDAGMPQPPSAVEPGKGAVPVNPFMGGGGKTTSLPVSDMPRAK